MKWSDYLTQVQEAAQQPTVLLICALLVFVAGLLAGRAARARDNEAGAEPPEAGDTHAHLPALPPTRRVRAIGADLKPSYDARKAHRATSQPTPTPRSNP